jgi:hypothetical protein
MCKKAQMVRKYIKRHKIIRTFIGYLTFGKDLFLLFVNFSFVAFYLLRNLHHESIPFISLLSDELEKALCKELHESHSSGELIVLELASGN